MDDLDLSQLDPGIRDTVSFLRDNGFKTTDSGDGTSKPDMECAIPMANVSMVVEVGDLVAEADRLARLVLSTGHGLGPVGIESGDAEIQASYDPATRIACIIVLNFVVPWEGQAQVTVDAARG